MAQKYIGVTLPIRNSNVGMFEQSTTLIQQTRSNFRNLILTVKGERLFQPELGCDIWRILYEQLSEDTIEQSRLSITDAVERWLPHLELVNLSVVPQTAQNKLSISCTYRFRNNPNVTDTVVILAPEF